MKVLRNSSFGPGFICFDQARGFFPLFTIVLTGGSTCHSPLSLRLTSPIHCPIFPSG
jgi:hypothetical protein